MSAPQEVLNAMWSDLIFDIIMTQTFSEMSCFTIKDSENNCFSANRVLVLLENIGKIVCAFSYNSEKMITAKLIYFREKTL